MESWTKIENKMPIDEYKCSILFSEMVDRKTMVVLLTGEQYVVEIDFGITRYHQFLEYEYINSEIAASSNQPQIFMIENGDVVKMLYMLSSGVLYGRGLRQYRFVYQNTLLDVISLVEPTIMIKLRECI